MHVNRLFFSFWSILLLLASTILFPPAAAQTTGTDSGADSRTARFESVEAAMAQIREPIPVTRITAPVTLDGLSNEPAWENVEPFPVWSHEPVFGAAPSERTEMLVAYDDDYLYFAIRAYDSNPDGIRGNILYRNGFGSDDFFEVLLDTYNDNETTILFNTNPAGNRRDAEITNDASGAFSRWFNLDFNTYWDVETTVNEEGWFAEIRVPFSSLRFQEDEDGRVIMGLSMQRIIARKSERLTFPPIEPDQPFAQLKASRAQKIELRDIQSHRPLYIRPYGLAGMERAARLADDQSSYEFDETRVMEPGLDIKYGVTNNMTLDLTLNTDFAQVEADDQQVNLTRFDLFYPEKRQFFQERAGLFEFRTGGNSRLFHSRRIGLTDDGEIVRILGGARLVGRSGPWEYGLLNMQTDRQGDLAPENFGTVRLRRQVFNPYSYTGGMVTNRIAADGHYNVAYGLDGTFRLYGDDYLSFQWAHTMDESQTPENRWSPAESGRFSGMFEKRRRDGIGYQTTLTWSGPDYNPGMGFIQRSDFTYLNQDLSYSWRPDDDAPLQWHTFLIGGETWLRNEDRSVETVELGPEWSFARRNGDRGSIGVQMIFEDIRQPFYLDDDVYVPHGDYLFYQAAAGYTVHQSRLFRVGANLEAGSFFDGRRFTLSLSPSWNASPHLELGGSYSYNHIRFADRDQQMNAHLGRLRVTVPFNTQISTHLFVQYNSVSDLVSTNARFRYNFREGNDLWIVYNEELNTDRYQFVPERPRSNIRTFMIKYTYTFLM